MTSRNDHSRSVVLRMFFLTMGTVFIALLAFTAYAYRSFESRLYPEVYKKLTVVGQSLEAQINRAINLGIPIGELNGMPEFLGQAIENNPEIQYILISDKQNNLLFSQGEAADEVAQKVTSMDLDDSIQTLSGVDAKAITGYYNMWIVLTYKDTPVGVMNLGVNNQYVDQMSEVAWDVGTVLFVSLLLAYQFIIILVNQRISFPIRQLEYLNRLIEKGDFRKTVGFAKADEVTRLTRTVHHLVLFVNKKFESLRQAVGIARAAWPETGQVRQVEVAYKKLKDRFQFTAPENLSRLWTASLDNARIPLFFGVFAEELSRSFLPIYIDNLYMPVPGLTREMAIGVPISLFMVVIAVSTPWAGGRVERFRPRNVFLLGMIPAVIGFAGMVMARNIYDLMLWRSLCAVGYAMQTMACQGYIAHNTSQENRSYGMAVFVSTIMIAAICGSSIGGVLADRIGYRGTFVVSVVMILISGIAAFKSLHEKKIPANTAKVPRLSWKSVRQLACNVRFSLLILFAAIPAKIMLTGFLFYLMPVFLIKLGNQQADVGRMMMIYFIIMVAGVPLSARLADKSGKAWLFVLVGGFLAGLAMMVVWIRQDTLAIIISITLFGLGQSISTSTLIAMILEVTPKESQAIGQTNILGLFRVLERVGSVAGPFIVAALIVSFGHAGSMIGVGAIMIGATLALLAGLWLTRARASESKGDE